MHDAPPKVSTARDGAVTTIRIERPSRKNAVDNETAAALFEAFTAFEADPDASVAVLCGAGETFCSGADLKAFAEGNGNRIDAAGPGPMGPTRMALSKPVIAAVEGYAVAGGLELALWADLRVAARDATFGVFCRRVGVPLIDGGTVRLPRLVGLSRALDWTLSGRPVSAEEGFRAGLVHRLVAPGTALEEAQGWAEALVQLPQACLRADRRALYHAFDGDEVTLLNEEFAQGITVLDEARGYAARFAAGEGRSGEALRS